jgi:hypothetical protein
MRKSKRDLASRPASGGLSSMHSHRASCPSTGSTSPVSLRAEDISLRFFRKYVEHNCRHGFCRTTNMKILMAEATRRRRGGAKWGSERIVPIPSRTGNELQAMIKSNPYQDPADLIFSLPYAWVPVGKHVLSDRFNEALGRIGVTEAQRKDRRLVFHSTRHAFNSIMRGRIEAC